MARGAATRLVALLLMGLLPLPHAASLARAWALAADPDCACVKRACCCPPAAKPTPAPCHSPEGDAAPGPVVGCHHRSALALVPALPALVSPRASAVVEPHESRVPFSPPGTPRLGFGRIESPPPRSSGNA